MFSNMMGNFQMVQKLLKDENFRKLMLHPKFQGLISNTEFQQALKAKDMQKISSHPKFQEMMKDPELAQILSKVDFKSMMQ